MKQPEIFDELDPCVDKILQFLGKDIRVGLPLGLGKPPQLINALYARAKADPTIQLTILTALSLEKPVAKSKYEAAFLDPFKARVWGNCPDLDYAVDLSKGLMPTNVQVKEFFFRPGSRLDNLEAQRNYICTNYTTAVRDIFNQGCNLVVQLVCKPAQGELEYLSLSCNPDLTLSMVHLLRGSGRSHMVVGQVNQNLPYMAHDAQVPSCFFNAVLDNSSYYTTLFSVPKMSVGLADFAIGLYASALLKDGGTLQVGIGVLGDALVHATSLRHLDNTTYHHALKQLGLCEKVLALIEHIGGTSPFEKGLYSATEMFVDGLLYLYEAGVLKRKVYDFWALEQLVQNKQCDPTGLDECLFTQMASLGVREITPQNLITLQEHGVLPHSVLSEGADFILPNGKCVVANLVCSETCLELGALAVGRVLQNGVLLHGGFFLGTQAMYHTLSQFSQSERDLFSMTGVDKVNQLDENPLLYHAQRVHARFINTGLVLTLSGAVASDGLDDGRVISGVGGQYNFVAMAEQLEDARSILLIRAVRERAGEISSNVVFNYGHCTIPRHLRDIVVTEYGVADLQGKTDREIAKALIEIADSRFQGLLLEQAKKAGKIEAAYVIPSRFLNNTPQGLQAKLSGLQRQGFLPEYPLGTDFTEQEQMLEKALLVVKKQTTQKPKWVLAVCALFYRDISNELKPYLERMQLTQSVTLEDKVVRMLLCQALQKQINAMAQ